MEPIMSVQDAVIAAVGTMATGIVGVVGEMTRRRAKRLEEMQAVIERTERDRARLSAREAIKNMAQFELLMLLAEDGNSPQQIHTRSQEIKMSMLEDLANVDRLVER